MQMLNTGVVSELKAFSIFQKFILYFKLFNTIVVHAIKIIFEQLDQSLCLEKVFADSSTILCFAINH